MGDQRTDVAPGGEPDDAQRPIDPLRRIFQPVEKRTERGTWVFRTHDQQVYARLDDGSIRRTTSKVNGKEAKRARRRARNINEVRTMADTKRDKDAAPENPGQVKMHDYQRTNASGGYETAQFPQSSHQAAKAAGWKRVDGKDGDEKRADDSTDAGGGTDAGGTNTGGGETPA